ncbi:13962_t:CDS:2, partial [Acaulospora morrowiae]
VILAYPFLVTYPRSYIGRAFEFSRVFTYKWTVNWKFFDEETFLDTGFANVLLIGHGFVLVTFLFRRWCRKDGGVLPLLFRGFFWKREDIFRQSKAVTAD